MYVIIKISNKGGYDWGKNRKGNNMNTNKAIVAVYSAAISKVNNEDKVFTLIIATILAITVCQFKSFKTA